MYIIPQRAKKSTNKIIKFDKKFTVSGVISIYLAYTIKNEVSNSRDEMGSMQIRQINDDAAKLAMTLNQESPCIPHLFLLYYIGILRYRLICGHRRRNIKTAGFRQAAVITINTED